MQMAPAPEPEGRVVSAGRACVGDIHETTVYRDAYRLSTVRGRDVHQLEAAVPLDTEDRDLITAGIYSHQVAAIGALLQCSLRADGRARAGATG